MTIYQNVSGLNRKAHPTAAGRHRVRVLDPERLAHEIIDEIELGALQHFERHGVDQDGRAVARHGDEIGRAHV